MVRKYVKKTQRAEIDENIMKQAIRECLIKKCKVREASRLFGIKRSTLQSRIKKIRSKGVTIVESDSGHESESEEPLYANKYTVNQVFTNAEEHELEAYIKRSSDLNYGLSYRQIRTLAYEYAEARKKKVPETWIINKMAGIEWLKGFMSRHNTLSLRKPESTSLSRSTGFNKVKVEEFFSNYVQVMEKFHFKPENIFNLDESGVTTVMPPVKIVSTKGKKQVSQTTSAERGERVTFVGVINAVGNFIPPVYIFPRIRKPEEYLTDAPIGSLALGNKSGWMTTDLFPTVLQHLITHTKCSKDKPILLLIDNHESHVSVKAIKLCRENGITLLSFPPHTTHRLQPLDVGVFGPFKTALSVAFDDWILSHPGKAITIRSIGQLSSLAFRDSFTMKNIQSGFQKAGIWPINRLAFTDMDFLPSSVTDLPLEDNQHMIEDNACSENPSNAIVESNTTELSDANVSLEEIRPYPKCNSRKITKRKRQSKSTVYTSTPEFQIRENFELEKERSKNILKNKKAVKRKLFKESTPSSNSEDEETTLEDDESSDDENALNECAEKVITKDDFVLVKFPTKSSVCYYVGKVLKNSGCEFEIDFLRRKGSSETFIFPQVREIRTVERSDIRTILPQPKKSATARTSNLFRFGCNFRGLDLR